MKIIIVSGYYASGSSAVVDLLREFGNGYVCDGEFRLISDPCGIRMLEEGLVNHWTPIRSTAAIDDFLQFAKKCCHKKSQFPLASFGMGYADKIHHDFWEITCQFVDSLVSDTYFQDYYFHKARKPYLSYVVDRCRYGIQYYSRNSIPIAKKYRCYFSKPSKELFESSVRKYFDNLFENREGKDFVVLDQGIHPCDSDVIDRYFTKAKLILVDRDLRDVYISSAEHYGVIDADISSYMQRQNAVRDNVYDSQNVLRIRFENLVQNYDEMVEKIMNFCEIDAKCHILPKKYFNPNHSQKNVGIWKKYYEKYSGAMDFLTDRLNKSFI